MGRKETIAELQRRVKYLDGLQNDCWNAREREAEAASTDLSSMRDMRVPTLAISLMLRDRADALQTPNGAAVQQAFAEYARADRLRALLGEVTAEEEAAAIALWDETADVDGAEVVPAVPNKPGVHESAS